MSQCERRETVQAKIGLGQVFFEKDRIDLRLKFKSPYKAIFELYYFELGLFLGHEIDFFIWLEM